MSHAVLHPKYSLIYIISLPLNARNSSIVQCLKNIQKFSSSKKLNYFAFIYKYTQFFTVRKKQEGNKTTIQSM